MTKSTKRGKAAPSMSLEEFREYGFILCPKVLAEIVSLVTGPNYNRRAAPARVRALLDAGAVARRRALRSDPGLRLLVRAGHIAEARRLVGKGGA